MTLARDLATLARHGYGARTAWPVDMMPQTWHVEVVCLLESTAGRRGA
jgi:23S rRNA (uracil1939-C5)-methyltransferase